MPERIIKTPSPKQLEVLRQLQRFQHRHGYSPTLEELGRILGVTRVTVYQYVRALERKGLLKRLRNRARSLQLVEDAAPHLSAFNHRQIWPLVGQWKVGGKIKFHVPPRKIDAELLLQRYRETSALKVVGNSPEEPSLRDGDYLLIEPLSDRHTRRTALIQQPGGQVRLCPFARRCGQLYLDRSAKTMLLRPADILGVVVALLRTY